MHPAKEAHLLALVAAGDTVLFAARTVGMPYSTAKDRVALATINGRLRPKDKTRAEVLGRILDANLRFLLTAAETLDDPAYLAGQNVRDIGITSGIVADKSLRLAERLAQLEHPDGPGDDLDGPAETGPAP